MSRTLTSPDVARLVGDGYSVRVTDQYLVVSDIPYLAGDGTVRTNGMIASAYELDRNGLVKRPHDHTVNFFGDELPCDSAGRPLDIRADKGTFVIDGRKALAYCSRHRQGGDYADFFEKMTSYVSFITAPARKVDAKVTARLNRPPVDETGTSVFAYGDSATARNGTGDLAAKLEGRKVAIVGLGGTGGYVLDFVSKTPVSEILLFDGDGFFAHNAFRAPGAASQEAFGKPKAEHFARVYSAMHKGVKCRAKYLEEGNLASLDGVGFVFLCLDDPKAKGPIVRHLQERGIPFVDAGMAVVRTEGGALGGAVRTTFCSADEQGRLTAEKYVGMEGGASENMYDADIQIAELNALNAAMAVIRWKRSCGYYGPSDRQRGVSYANMVYSLSGDCLHHEKSGSQAA